MLTVVMLNWARQENVLKNLVRYSGYDLVERVFCFNNGERLPLAAGAIPKCVVVEASQDLGLYTRFAIGALAPTDAILHTDDDIVVPESTLTALYSRWQTSPESCHGLYGRKVTDGYERDNLWGRVEVVLTRAVVCSSETNMAALAVRRKFDDLICQPVGNGEDIVLSFAAMSLSRQLNFAHQLPAEQYPEKSTEQAPIGIHLRWRGHLEHRSRVVTRCRALFQLKAPPLEASQVVAEPT